MKDEARNGTKIPLTNYRERVLAATGISKCTYSKITSKEFINGVWMEAFIPTKGKGDYSFSWNYITSHLRIVLYVIFIDNKCFQ